ncbi:RRP5-like protein [Cryptosporidium canis]|uniref:RRP5-like protein n=1 Tax=Cryptosporidium canis TaxID=195482 RepID=A0A9D5HWS3_9CRYT|nr:RRP5-like protein [Cryptosporidium canis]
MNRKRAQKSTQDEVEELEEAEYGDFIGIKSKNLKALISSSNIERRDLKFGTLLFGVIDEVTEKELTISFPGSNTAIVSVENTLEDSNVIPPTLFGNLSKKSLKERFNPGEFVNGAVISNNKVKNNVTLKPSILNAGINSNSKCLNVFGYVISGMIVSKESHGFNIFTGIQGVKSVFMKVEGSGTRDYQIGQILPVSIDKYFKEKSLLTCTPIYDETERSTIGRKELLSIHEMKPGLKVECLIHSRGSDNQKEKKAHSQSPSKKRKLSDKVGVHPNTKILQFNKIDKQFVTDQELQSVQDYLQDDHSLQVSFCMGTMLGVIPNEHSIHPLACFYPEEFRSPLNSGAAQSSPKSKFITARIIAILSGTENKIVLSALPHNVNLPKIELTNFDEIRIGSIVYPSSSCSEDSTQGLKSLSSITLFNSQNNKNSQEKIGFLARISGKWVSFSTRLSTKDHEKIDSTIKTQPFRVISHSRLENSILVSFDQKVVQEKYFSSQNVLPGQIVKATVTEIHAWGISVRLSDYFSGRIYKEHLFNSSASGSGNGKNSVPNSSKSMSKDQMDYVKKHYQIGRSYQFKILRYEYSDNSWNPLLLLTAKNLLISDQLPVVREIDGSLQVGQKITGYISRICLGNPNQDHKDYIIIRFYGEAYGSISYKEYLDFYEFEGVHGVSRKPAIGEVITVQIKSIDLANKSLKLTFGMQSKETEDPKSSSSSPLNRQFLSQIKVHQYAFYDELFEESNLNSRGFTLLGVATEGLLFSKGFRDLFYVPKFSISDSKENSEKIYSLLREIYQTSKSVSELNSRIFHLDFSPAVLSDHVSKLSFELGLVGSPKSQIGLSGKSINLGLSVKIAYMKHSLGAGELAIKNFKALAVGTLCIGYINHIDHYGLLISILSSEPLTGIVPRHLISSKVFFDGKEQLAKHFSIGETLLLKVVKLDDNNKKVTLSLKDLEDGTAFMQKRPTTKSFLKEMIKGLEQDDRVVGCLLDKSSVMKGDKGTSVSKPNLIGRVLELKIQANLRNYGIYMAKSDSIGAPEGIYFKLVSGDMENGIRKEFSKGDRITALVIARDYLPPQDSKAHTGVASEAKYVYFVSCEDHLMAGFSQVLEQKKKSASLRLKNKYSKFLDSIVGETKSIDVANEENIVFQVGQLTISVLVIGGPDDEKFPVIVLSPKILKERLCSRSPQFKCSILDHIENTPMVLGVLHSSMEEANPLKNTSRDIEWRVNDKVQCKIIEHMKSYQGLVVQLPNKSFGRISIMELDDDRMDKPLELEKFKVGKTIQGIVIDQLENVNKKSRKVILTGSKSMKTKYVTLEYEISSRISRIRDILGERDLEKEVRTFSQIEVGSILSGYVSNSGREGVFVRIGRDLVGRIKLRELTLGTITPEEASQRFFVGKFIEKMIVVDRNEDEKKIDLSISKLDSDDIKLRLSQMKHGVKKDDNENDMEDGGETGWESVTSALGNINEKLSFEDLFVGRILGGVVKNISKNGVFIRLNDLSNDLTGLCKFSECLDKKSDMETVSSIFKIGGSVLCKVLKLDPKNRRVWVGLKPSYFSKLNEDEECDILNSGRNEYIEGDTDETEEGDDTSMYDEEKSSDIGLELNDEGLEYRELGQDGMEVPMEDGLALSELETEGAGGSGDGAPEVSRKNLNREQKVQRQLELEHRIREEEEKGMRSHLDPSTIDDFERLLVTHRDVSSLWIRYMSYYLDLGELDKARMIAERSLRQISVKEEMERWNMWIAYINMEIVYGRNDISAGREDYNSSVGKSEIPKNVREVLDRALVNVCDQKKMYIQIFGSLKKYSKEEHGLALLEEGLKKFQTSRKLWMTYLTCLYENDNQKKARDEVIQKSLRSVSKHKVVRLITDIGRLEFDYGNVNRGRTIFENLLEENPKRMDLWSQYFDILTRLCNSSDSEASRGDHIEMARSVFNSCLEKNFKPRSMKMVFTRWLSFEKQFGSLQSQKHVQDLAINYVSKVESGL